MELGCVTCVLGQKVLAAVGTIGAIGAIIGAQFDAPPRKTECAI